MRYVVIKPFQDISGFKMPGEFIELTNDRAAKLRVNGLIGGEYKKSIEKAIPNDIRKAEIEELAGLYPESKVYKEKKAKTKKVK